jgi:hypothetical protein
MYGLSFASLLVIVIDAERAPPAVGLNFTEKPVALNEPIDVENVCVVEIMKSPGWAPPNTNEAAPVPVNINVCKPLFWILKSINVLSPTAAVPILNAPFEGISV